ncbi:MAG: hypothetical protein DME99_01745, partial [Verrucomicrobia bacterium]
PIKRRHEFFIIRPGPSEQAEIAGSNPREGTSRNADQVGALSRKREGEPKRISRDFSTPFEMTRTGAQMLTRLSSTGI